MKVLKNATVLIVDDNEANIYALRSYLETADLKIEAALNGKEAIDLLLSGKNVDIILLDMMMPVMDGYETLDVLRNSEALKHIPVVALTAKAMKGDKEKCLKAGAWDYISKPVNLKVLMDIITHWVAK
ncbi:MAG TPA: response regulator [Cytophagaceae bacterium]|jgi:two-component system chemotaxis sensor kinase CheA|nr:response regulator [Cytophagaceae bacterium]